jgi:hypothetical protein
VSLWSEGGARRNAFAAPAHGAAHLVAVERLKDWTRQRFALGEDDTVLVNESVPQLPGFPPRLTGVAFWTPDGTRFHYRVYKGVEEVGLEDLPPAWMKPSLAWDGFDCDCC